MPVKKKASKKKPEKKLFYVGSFEECYDDAAISSVAEVEKYCLDQVFGPFTEKKARELASEKSYPVVVLKLQALSTVTRKTEIIEVK